MTDVLNQATGEGWTLVNGDCAEIIKAMPERSIDFTIYSPPFDSLYTYTNSDRDLGNCRNGIEFHRHFRFVLRELFRVTKSGRNMSVHCMDLPTSKVRDGQIGLKDFPGQIIRSAERIGWIWHSKVTIWKDPVTAMQRTKALGLLHKQVLKDSCMSRMGIPDYVLTFRRPGVNPNPVSHDRGDFPVTLWQKWASPVWDDINPSDTLQFRSAREHEDERHICLAKGSLILTRLRGYVTIEDVSVGDLVLTHMGRWMPVTNKKCNGVAEIIRTCAQGVADLRTTSDHKLWSRIARGSHPRRHAFGSDPQWMSADSTLGSYLNLKLPPIEENSLTENEWWIVGRWLGDGHRGGHHRSGVRGGLGQFYISCSHEEAPQLIKRLGPHAGHAARVTATQIALINLRREVRDVLDRCGSGAQQKRLPGEAVALSQEKSESLLAGYLSADGHYIKRYDRWMASSVSRALLLGVALVAQRARGVVASVYAGRPDRDGTIKGRAVRMRQDWILAFRNSRGYRQSGWIGDDGAWKKVRKIESSVPTEVWDLAVAGDSSFTAEGAIVHNCPLQLEVIRRCVRLWSNPGDVILSPFAGIGSEGHVALQEGRHFVGVELKGSYYEQAAKNLAAAEPDGVGQQLPLLALATPS